MAEAPEKKRERYISPTLFERVLQLLQPLNLASGADHAHQIADWLDSKEVDAAKLMILFNAACVSIEEACCGSNCYSVDVIDAYLNKLGELRNSSDLKSAPSYMQSGVKILDQKVTPEHLYLQLLPYSYSYFMAGFNTANMKIMQNIQTIVAQEFLTKHVANKELIAFLQKTYKINQPSDFLSDIGYQFCRIVVMHECQKDPGCLDILKSLLSPSSVVNNVYRH